MSFHAIPTPLLFLLVVGGAVLLASLAVLATRRRLPHEELEKHHDVAGFVYAGIGVLYGVVLAFVVVIVWEQHTTASDNVEREADAVSNVYETVQVFPDPQRSGVQAAVKSYTQLVIDDEWQAMTRGEESPAARQAFARLWEQIRTIRPNSAFETNWHAELVRQMGVASDLRQERLSEARGGLPRALWMLLILGAIVNVGFTLMFGVENRWAQLVITGSLACMTALLFLLTIVINHPFAGEYRVTPEPFQLILQDLSA